LDYHYLVTDSTDPSHAFRSAASMVPLNAQPEGDHLSTTMPARAIRAAKGAILAATVAGAFLIPATQAQAATVHCAHHTTGRCAPSWVRHPRGVTAECRDHTWSYSAHFSGTCSHHRGVLYWFK
jgi:hypothetical protein